MLVAVAEQAGVSINYVVDAVFRELSERDLLTTVQMRKLVDGSERADGR